MSNLALLETDLIHTTRWTGWLDLWWSVFGDYVFARYAPGAQGYECGGCKQQGIDVFYFIALEEDTGSWAPDDPVCFFSHLEHIVQQRHPLVCIAERWPRQGVTTP